MQPFGLWHTRCCMRPAAELGQGPPASAARIRELDLPCLLRGCWPASEHRLRVLSQNSNWAAIQAQTLTNVRPPGGRPWTTSSGREHVTFGFHACHDLL